MSAHKRMTQAFLAESLYRMNAQVTLDALAARRRQIRGRKETGAGRPRKEA